MSSSDCAFSPADSTPVADRPVDDAEQARRGEHALVWVGDVERLERRDAVEDEIELLRMLAPELEVHEAELDEALVGGQLIRYAAQVCAQLLETLARDGAQHLVLAAREVAVEGRRRELRARRHLAQRQLGGALLDDQRARRAQDLFARLVVAALSAVHVPVLSPAAVTILHVRERR